MEKIAVVTGASAGIGRATARGLAEAGFGVVLAARRLERLEELASEIGGRAIELDVTDDASVAKLASSVDRVDLLVNNAGAAHGLEGIADADQRNWETMYQLNVLGVLRVTGALLPALRRSSDAQIVNLGSVAGFETYPGGGGYTASKHALRAMTTTLRQELLGEPIKVTEICPGLVETEFSLVRFAGDAERAAAVYQGMTPLVAEDVAACIVFAATRPPHVNIDEIVVKPRDQASSLSVHRRATEESHGS